MLGFVFSFSVGRKERWYRNGERRRRWRQEKGSWEEENRSKWVKETRKMSSWSKKGASCLNPQRAGQGQCMIHGSLKTGFSQAENGRFWRLKCRNWIPFLTLHALLPVVFTSTHSYSLWLALAKRILANMMETEAWQVLVQVALLVPAPLPWLWGHSWAICWRMKDTSSKSWLAPVFPAKAILDQLTVATAR